MENTWAASQSKPAHDAFNAQKKSPWTNNYIPYGTPNIYSAGCPLPAAYVVNDTQGPPFNNPLAPTKVTDTLPPAAVAQYYPQGFPTNMIGAYTPMSYKKQKDIDNLTATPAEREKKRKDAVDNLFYSGQRRFATMTSEDYITELEELHHQSYGPISPPNKDVGPSPAVKKSYTVEEIVKMPIEKVMAPIMNVAFGTMLSYAMEGFNSRRALSGWVPADPNQIDDTPEGNKSLFGEDWGAPPSLRNRASYRGSSTSSHSNTDVLITPQSWF
jgi:hypothetical protein